VDIVRIGPNDAAAVMAAAAVFDHPPRADATARFLAERGHHLLIAYDGAAPVGFISGVETVHPDKGAEMFLYELGVAGSHRRRGIGRALVEALAALAREQGCYGMWVATDEDNVAALATYRSVGALRDDERSVILTWSFADR
jgi:[ribosomal protein S18]-alanine N-acetyltransferase